ncbi:class I SAM-dependent DNA methyltransferase [Nakamurella sp.]|uniref:class I SAM-dependent DNA methyltransferase n=1 Tax=Nakamurella sp. TaxID=1869182 RepID=UPI003B3AD591
MSAWPALVVGEGWISEHYFGSDAGAGSFRAEVFKRRKEWDEEAAADRPTPRSRFTRERQRLEADLGLLGADLAAGTAGTATDERAAAIGTALVTILEWDGHGLHHRVDGPVTRVGAPGVPDRTAVALVQARPVLDVETILDRDADTLTRPVVLDEERPALTSASRLVSALFVDDDPPAFVLVLAGRWVLLLERDRWAEGRYLAVDVQTVCERNDAARAGEIDRMLCCLSAPSVAPGADGQVWWKQILEESVKHTVGVSKDLRDGVRLSIELIANEVVDRRRAAELPPLPADQAQPLAVQSLRFLYRILFLLYAEASPHLGVLPVGAAEYDQGYSLDRLRELVQVTLATEQARNGTHLYESLGALFRLVDRGHTPAVVFDPDDDGDPKAAASEAAFGAGLTFHGLRADLFKPEATAHIDAVGLGNQTLQKVLQHLLLSKEKRGRDRGFISYAELGINQLGAVYEGLMSYTGFFAVEDLYEVAKDGNSEKGSWVVPVRRSDGIDAKDFVKHEDELTHEMKPVLHRKGRFVFRLAGRERQQSASYYTPEVLTKFTVGQALAELLDQDGKTTPAADILEMTVCEPALGSGAFAIEAIRQLAEQYLTRRQSELGERIDPDHYPRQLQQVKAYLALHNVYGVDLNATAVELAEISIWLDTMAEGLAAPWFGLHLRRGNSLIGARRAVHPRADVSSKAWLTAIPRDEPLTSLVDDIEHERVGGGLGGAIHHFLLPADGWGSAVEAKEAVALAPDAAKALKQWRTKVKAKLTRKEVDDLTELAHRVEVLWQFAFRRLEVAEREIRRSIPVWGANALPVGGAVQREQIEAALADPNGAYQRLRLVMDAWCALWFWPLTDALTKRDSDDAEPIPPPDLAEWIAGLQSVLGRSPELRRPTQRGNRTLGEIRDWDELGQAEENELLLAGAVPIDTVVQRHPWLRVCRDLATQQGFFHWQLEFATVFAKLGGFDLQLGNPPWVRPDIDVEALMAESDPWWVLAIRPTQSEVREMRRRTLANSGASEIIVNGASELACIGSFVISPADYPYTAGLRPDLYRAFMQQAWRNASENGITGLIHPETHFTDEKAGRLRRGSYRRLRQHWQFINELHLFEVHHLVSFGVHIYGYERDPAFRTATSLYRPETAVHSLVHDGSGPVPGLKNEAGQWDVTPHRARIILVDIKVLASWREILDADSVPSEQARMVYSVNRSVEAVVSKLTHARRIAGLGLNFSGGWNETTDRQKGRFDVEWGEPSSWDDVILQGPHFHVANPYYKSPNSTMRNNLDWSLVDLEALQPDSIPTTSYKRSGDRYGYDCAYTDWGDDDRPQPSRDYFRVAWRKMAANTGERTLITAIIPPGGAHIDAVLCLGSPSVDARRLAVVAGLTGSLLCDFSVRVSPKANIRYATIDRLPLVDLEHPLVDALILRTLRLNALTEAYGDLWSGAFSNSFAADSWTWSNPACWVVDLGAVGHKWNSQVALRRGAVRRQALLEVDALVALMLGVTVDELCIVYRTQFPVLFGYDRNRDFYDSNGRLVPTSVIQVWKRKGDAIDEDERTATNASGYTYTYELPFCTLDREHDMRVAYAEFERRLAQRA